MTTRIRISKLYLVEEQEQLNQLHHTLQLGALVRTSTHLKARNKVVQKNVTTLNEKSHLKKIKIDTFSTPFIMYLSAPWKQSTDY